VDEFKLTTNCFLLSSRKCLRSHS